MYNRKDILEKGGEKIIKGNSREDYCYFVNNGEFFYVGQILKYYDRHCNYLMNVEILKFFIRYHKKNKVPYIKVQVRFLDGFKSHMTKIGDSDINVLDFKFNAFITLHKIKVLCNKR